MLMKIKYVIMIFYLVRGRDLVYVNEFKVIERFGLKVYWGVN